MKPYSVPAKEARVETQVLNSRFIVTAAPVTSVDEARQFITRIKQEHADATHNVPAYLIGHGSSVIAHCHDDGEPSGTAGRPALAVLQGSGLGDVAVVVTRYFGGTKLGTGGLVRAYGDAVRAVLHVLPRAEKVATHTVSVISSYADYARLRSAIEAYRGQILREEFAGEVTVQARLPVDQFALFEAALGDLSGGMLQVQILAANVSTILPVPSASGLPENGVKSQLARQHP